MVAMLISYLCFAGLFLFTVSADHVIRKGGYCVMYGQQQPYNGPAKNMSDEHFTLLKSICPYLTVNGKNDTTSCCDQPQVITLQQSMKTVSTLLSSCPACYRNFMSVWCELTCSSNQSMFVDFQTSVLRYYVTNQFADGLYDSCRDVEVMGQKVMDLMCGTSAEKCTPEKFLKYVGDPASGAPVLIDFHINQTVTNISSNDFQMKRCNQSFVEAGTEKKSPACSCQNCRDTICSPTSPPPPERPSNKYVITINATTDFPIDMYRVYQKSGPPKNFSGLIHKYILKEVLNLHQNISKIKGELDSDLIHFEDVCMKSTHPNNTNCKVESLLQYFQMNEVNLDKCMTDFNDNCNDPSKIGLDAEDWHDQILGCTRFPASVSNGKFLKLSCLSTYGAPILPNRVLANYEKGDYISAKSLILTYFLNDDLNATQQLQKEAWGEALEKFLNTWQANYAPALNLSLSFKHEIPPNNGTATPTSGASTTAVTTTTPVSTTKKKSNSASYLKLHIPHSILMFIFAFYFVLNFEN